MAPLQFVRIGIARSIIRSRDCRRNCNYEKALHVLFYSMPYNPSLAYSKHETAGERKCADVTAVDVLYMGPSDERHDTLLLAWSRDPLYWNPENDPVGVDDRNAVVCWYEAQIAQRLDKWPQDDKCALIALPILAWLPRPALILFTVASTV
jgi:hypothetical protein